MINLPEAFDTFSEARKAGFIEIMKLKEEGRKVVGTYCTFTPWEIIMAAGAIPISLCGTSNEPIAAAEEVLPRNLCPLIKSSYGHAITDTCPYFYFSDMLVGETTCDGKKKMYEYLGEIKPMHIMQLPQSGSNGKSLALWRDEIISLKERVEKEFNVEITYEKLKKAIKDRNEQRKALKEFYELALFCPPPISGYEMFQVLNGANFKTSKEEQVDSVAALTKQIKELYDKGARRNLQDSPRILITGCPIGGVSEKIVKAVEDNGGVIVCFENCSGVKAIDTLVDEDKDPFEALAEKYISIACSCMSPNNNRIELLSELIDKYRVQGVIDVILQACHTYNIETYSVKRLVNEKKNLPYISIETDYSQNDTGQLKTRLAAFVEMLDA
ncbi:R-phenyllactate dehydratase beta subunit [Oxobacter pfennigii]|uniref:R-phenyllactate dehydratase beta subunit n=1 Tax=Oxobacter pfennigii TaxID=36849 RepID=A0A0P8YS18_9CLOT|nr:double-cubane-cluster-containing anaerobic reductase [Oxobacter pfennigii]KPU42433.1 R-phenyllactate dehydratase beta subunit [Oxobacter pfennigii]